LQTIDTYTPVIYNDNVNNAIFDQQPMSNNNVITSLDHNNQQYRQPIVASPNHNHQQQYNDSNNIPLHNYQQHIQQPGISNNNYQQPMSNNVASNNSDTFSSNNHHHVSNNIPYHNSQQQSTFDNASPPQFYHDQNQPNPPQSNILPLLNSSGININSPQSTIIIMPTTNSDIQNQLQQVLAYLNHSSTKTRFQQSYFKIFILFIFFCILP
jgi:hypothetical protein